MFVPFKPHQTPRASSALLRSEDTERPIWASHHVMRCVQKYIYVWLDMNKPVWNQGESTNM